MAFSMFCALSNAQNNMPTALDQLATQCQQVIDQNDTIKARQARLNVLTEQLEELKQNWLRTCNEALSSPACDDNATRLNTINELIKLTDRNFEAGLLAQLNEAKNNPEIRILKPDGQSTSSPRKEYTGQRNQGQKDKPTQPKQTVQPETKTVENPSESDKPKEEKGEVVNPITQEQPKDDKSPKKEESTTSPSTKDSKKDNQEKQGTPTKKEETGNKDKTKIEESKDQSNRNKTIELMNKNKNQNK